MVVVCRVITHKPELDIDGMDHIIIDPWWGIVKHLFVVKPVLRIESPSIGRDQ